MGGMRQTKSVLEFLPPGIAEKVARGLGLGYGLGGSRLNLKPNRSPTHLCPYSPLLSPKQLKLPPHLCPSSSPTKHSLLVLANSSTSATPGRGGGCPRLRRRVRICGRLGPGLLLLRSALLLRRHPLLLDTALLILRMKGREGVGAGDGHIQRGGRNLPRRGDLQSAAIHAFLHTGGYCSTPFPHTSIFWYSAVLPSARLFRRSIAA